MSDARSTPVCAGASELRTRSAFLARAGPLARAALAALAVCIGAGSARGQSLETPIKATYLYKVAPFVEWPPGAFPSAGSPFNLCIVGNDPFGAILDRAVAGQRVGDRPIALHRMETVQKATGCHAAYLAGSSSQSVAEGLKLLHNAPVLTITDGRGSGGMIAFELREQRVRFAIDEDAALDAGLRISSKLLSLAVDVQRKNTKVTGR